MIRYFLIICNVMSLIYHLLQSMNVLECQEFRELLLYLGEDKIDDSDLPHCTKMTLIIFEEFKAEHKRICGDLQVC
jgi:hypothetical protein